MLGCLLLGSKSLSDVAHNEYPDTDLGIRLDREIPNPMWTGWSIPWPDLELFLTRIILDPQSKHLRGRSRPATASWMLCTKQSRQRAWWPQGETCITARAWQHTAHASSGHEAKSSSSRDIVATNFSILLCSLLISSWVASCLFFSGSSVCSFSYFLDFLAPIKGARRPEKGPGAISRKKVTRFPPRLGQINAFFWRFLAAYCARGAVTL